MGFNQKHFALFIAYLTLMRFKDNNIKPCKFDFMLTLIITCNYFSNCICFF